MDNQLERNEMPSTEESPVAEEEAPQAEQPCGDLPEEEAHVAPYSNLSEREKTRVDEIQRDIEGFYESIPTALQASPEAQSRCLDHLLEAEVILARRPLHRTDIIESRLAVTMVEIELARAKTSRRSFMVVGILVYIIAALVILAFQFGLFRGSSSAAAMNQQLVVGIPLPVWIWAVIGSLTSMLLRAGQFPFIDINEAMRWLLFRPIVGIVMGVLTYLMVVAGLIVFAGSSEAQAPELIWVIAFVGSFSDTLSINLLQRVLGEFKAVEVPTERREQEQCSDQTAEGDS